MQEENQTDKSMASCVADVHVNKHLIIERDITNGTPTIIQRNTSHVIKCSLCAHGSVSCRGMMKPQEQRKETNITLNTLCYLSSSKRSGDERTIITLDVMNEYYNEFKRHGVIMNKYYLEKRDIEHSKVIAKLEEQRKSSIFTIPLF
eukprot:878516_1